MTNISSYLNNNNTYIYRREITGASGTSSTSGVSGLSGASGASGVSSASAIYKEIKLEDISLNEIVELFTSGNLTAEELEKMVKNTCQ